MKMSNNPVKYEVIIKQYLRSILNITGSIRLYVRFLTLLLPKVVSVLFLVRMTVILPGKETSGISVRWQLQQKSGLLVGDFLTSTYTRPEAALVKNLTGSLKAFLRFLKDS